MRVCRCGLASRNSASIAITPSAASCREGIRSMERKRPGLGPPAEWAVTQHNSERQVDVPLANGPTKTQGS